MTADPTLAPLDRLVGTWTTEATHPAMPGVVVHGTAAIEWLEGERFLILRTRTDHPDFPDAISIIGDMEADRVDDGGDPAPPAPSPWRMHYFDSRGVFRVYETRVTGDAWQWWRDAAGFSQRFTGRFADGGDTIVGLSQLRKDDIHWADDLAITYRRRRGS
jgi:hypothetical protein